MLPMKVKFSRGIRTPDTYDNSYRGKNKKKNNRNEKLKIPEITCKDLSVRLQFCDKFSHVRQTRSLRFLTPVSVNPPPHISRDWRFLKSVCTETHKNLELKNEKITASCRSKPTCKIKFVFESTVNFISRNCIMNQTRANHLPCTIFYSYHWGFRIGFLCFFLFC